eukprot:CAMPEP_0168395348 /NCGR_PEP_ID=MMETSP0228-20121227/19998_1 /TAXON_ID=133427 /ORGANISM="Protoceratium reticulatum, Strain CCCM 535 (=CCMP 1889)" /LENGTH=115 /DNA_ID=CAMNT_0008408779 /DNA_START=81 /DNA_END=424 /DNA_ORIENTATION=+
MTKKWSMRAPAARSTHKLFAYVALLAFAAQLVVDVPFAGPNDNEMPTAFAAPVASLAADLASARLRQRAGGLPEMSPVWGAQGAAGNGRKTARSAAAEANVMAKVINAMGAGAVA